MKLYFSILATAVGLTAAGAAEPDGVERSRQLRGDPLNNHPTPSSVRWHHQGTQIPTGTENSLRSPSPTASPHNATPIPTGPPLNPTLTPTGSPLHPTNTPSFSPSQSLPPTEECGPSIENYSYMGKGNCLDGDAELHNLVQFNNITSATDCAEKCNCASQSLTVQGFDYNSDTDQCRCRVDENSNLFNVAAGEGCGPNSQNTQNSGFGKVISTDGDDDFCCFRSDLTTAAPSVSSAPSTSLVPSTSTAPTNSLVPTHAHSVSLLPTQICGPPIENYSKMGKGK